MSSNYLWKLYFENDAEGFRGLLLEGALPPAHKGYSNASGVTQAAKSASGEAATGLGSEHKTTLHDITGIGSPSKVRRNLGSTLRGQKESKVTFSRQALREYDARGRALLHAACTDPKGLPFLEALLNHQQIDLMQLDLESGWTAMHRALYHGNISAARLLLDAEVEKIASGAITGGQLKAKDNSKEEPIELFYGTIEGCENSIQKARHTQRINRDEDEDYEDEDQAEDQNPAQRKRNPFATYRASPIIAQEGRGDEVFAFGSNKNLTLGFGDGDDRQYPERVPLQRPKQLLADLGGKSSYNELTAIEAFRPLAIQDIQLSKYHSVIITTDPYSNLYICGFGHGGRLGLGDEQLTQFTFRNVLIGDVSYCATQVALGLDHTVVVLRNGEIWTWGGNKHGQLGYTTGKTGTSGNTSINTTGGNQAKAGLEEAEFIQSTPRQVINGIKKEFIIGCAASRIHTVIHSSTSLYVFGKNEGQLGIIDSSDSKTLSAQSMPRKIAPGFLVDNTIRMVAATDRCTAVMLGARDVWIFANFGYARVAFPVQKLSILTGMLSVPRQAMRSDMEPNLLSKITTGGETLCGLTQTGDVYTVNLGDLYRTAGNSTSSNKLPSLVPQKAWISRKKHMAVKDVDVGQDGSIIICTNSGSVWKGVQRVKAKEVTSNSSSTPGGANHNSFSNALMNDTTKSKDYKFSRVPGLSRIVSVRSNKFGAYAAIRRDCDIMRTQLQVKGSFEDLINDFKPLLSVSNFLRSYIVQPKGRDLVPRLTERLSGLDYEDYDMVIKANNSNIHIPVHLAIVLGRSPVLRQMAHKLGKVNKPVEWEDGKFGLSWSGGKLWLEFKCEPDIEIVTKFVCAIYLDRFPYFATHAERKPEQQHTRLRQLCDALSVHELAVLRTDFAHCGINKDLKRALEDPLYHETGDMIVQLANDAQMWLHSAILRRRSPFFETLYNGSSGGRWIASRKAQAKAKGETAIKVDMSHVTLDVFKLVAEFMYTDSVDIFDQVKGMESLDQFLDYIVDVLAVANELMLDKLSMVCQKLLGSYVNTRNASQLLMAIAPCSQKGFKEVCLQYMCFNMESMLENRLLDELDDGLMQELDSTVRKLQTSSYPFTRNEMQKAMLLARYPTLEENSRKEHQALIARYSHLIEIGTADVASHKQKLSVPYVPSNNAGSSIEKKQKKKALTETIAPHYVASTPTTTGSDLLFDMEDEGSSLAAGVKMPIGTPTRKAAVQQGATSPVSSLGGGAIGSFDLKGPAKSWDAFGSPSAMNPTQQPSTPSTPSKPWKNTPASMAKLDMKEIMAQAAISSNRQSNLSLGLASSSKPVSNDKVIPISTPFTPSPKISQKEKRRQQQQQQQQQQHSNSNNNNNNNNSNKYNRLPQLLRKPRLHRGKHLRMAPA
ncbi:hypothetical protein BDZ91DRAFT_521229 [Kalaharituber pfeilii]|nr:hypothetical protein BDZ91DRAFT_521229 [Kalaharituber pfeilii]